MAAALNLAPAASALITAADLVTPGRRSQHRRIPVRFGRITDRDSAMGCRKTVTRR